MTKPKVLHLFNHYLPQTENWSYKLIKNTPSIKVYIGAMVYLKNNFYDSKFTFIEHPFGALETLNGQLDKRNPFQLFQKIILKILGFCLGNRNQTIATFAQHHQIAIVHAHFADVAWEFRTIAQQLNKPFVVSFYGWDYEQLPTTKPIFQKHYQELFQSVAAIICEGHHGARILEKMGCSKEKLKVVPLGVEPDLIPYYRREKSRNQLSLLQLATFTEKKGHLYALQAFAKALETCPNMTLTLIGGEGELGVKARVLEFVETHHLEDKVTILEAIDYAQLYHYLRQFQVFIHPSCYAANRDCEGGAPVVLLDAQATGMPAIATRHCDIPEEVIDGKTGLLAMEKEVGQLASHIQRFYEMEAEEYQTFSQNARQHVCDHYDIRQNAKKLREVYDSLC